MEAKLNALPPFFITEIASVLLREVEILLQSAAEVGVGKNVPAPTAERPAF